MKKAREKKINISSFVGIELRRYLALIEGKNTNYFPDNEMQSSKRDKQQKGSMGLPRFELKSMAPEATRMPSYPTGPNSQNKKIENA